MKVQVVHGDVDRSAHVLGVLARAHDVHVSHEVRPLRGVDAVVVVWPSEVQGRERAARLLTPLDARSSLVVVPVELTADRLGIAEAGLPYVVDPFHPMELVRRVELLAGHGGPAGRVLWAGDTMVDEGARLARRDGRDLGLTRKEFDLLAHLVRHEGQVQERDTLLRAVWSSTDYNPNVIEVTISSLRQKLERHGPRIVHTVRGIGYVCRLDDVIAPTLLGPGHAPERVQPD
jgi:two-component system OmpR family response regulator